MKYLSKTDKLLEIKNLNISFSNPDGIVQVVDNMNFYIGAGETLGVVGESGCGKSITALSINEAYSQSTGCSRWRNIIQ